MNNSNPRKKLFLAAAGGLAGFFVLLLAGLAFLRVLLSHIFGGALSLWENLTIYGLVPTAIAFGAGIPAWVLGANLWRCSLAGISAMLVFVFINVSGASINYAPFSEYETVAFIMAVLITVLIATAERNRLQSTGLATLLILATTLVGLRFILPGEELLLGFVVSFLAWIILPVVTAFFMVPEQKMEI